MRHALCPGGRVLGGDGGVNTAPDIEVADDGHLLWAASLDEII
jgi:hypothetical protein